MMLLLLLLTLWCDKIRKMTTAQRKWSFFAACLVHGVVSGNTKNDDSTTKMVVFDDFVVDMVVSQNTKNDDSTTKIDGF